MNEEDKDLGIELKDEEEENNQPIKDDKPLSPFMDFMVTYGWAMLVVVAAIGALWFFGVLNPNINTLHNCECGQCEISFENTTYGSGYNKISCCTHAEWNKNESKCEYIYQVSKIRALNESK